MTGYCPSCSGRNTSARSTTPSSMVIGTSKSIRMPSRTSVLCCNDAITPSDCLAMPAVWCGRPSAGGDLAKRRWPGQARPSMIDAEVILRGALASLHLRHLFEHRADRGRVAVAKTALHGLEVNAFGGVEDGCWNADLARVVADDVHVLVPHRNLHGDIVITAFRHHRCAQLEDARVAGARGDEVDNHLRVEAGFHAQHHRFCGGDVVDGDQKIGDVFHAAAVAELADIERMPAKA